MRWLHFIHHIVVCGWGIIKKSSLPPFGGRDHPQPRVLYQRPGGLRVLHILAIPSNALLDRDL